MLTFHSISWTALWSFVLLLSVDFIVDNVIAYFYRYRSNLLGKTFFHSQLWVILHIICSRIGLLSGVHPFVAMRIGDEFALGFLFGDITASTFKRVVNGYFVPFVPLIMAEIIVIRCGYG